MLARHVLLSLSLFALIPACGGDVEVETGGGATGSTTSGSGGGGSSGTTSGGSGGGNASSTSGSGAGGGDLCAGFEDATSPGTATIRVKNDSGIPIYLPANCNSERITITSVPYDGVDYAAEEVCLQTCQDLQISPRYYCGACAPISYRIEPGQARDIPWNGLGLRYDLTMPTECWEDPASQSACAQGVAAKPGEYRVRVDAYRSCYEDDCTCDADGTCTGFTVGDPITRDAAITWPTSANIEVDFEACSFGCPDPAAP